MLAEEVSFLSRGPCRGSALGRDHETTFGPHAAGAPLRLPWRQCADLGWGHPLGSPPEVVSEAVGLTERTVTVGVVSGPSVGV